MLSKYIPIQIVVVFLFGWVYSTQFISFNSKAVMAAEQSSDSTKNGEQLVLMVQSGLNISFSSGAFLSSTGTNIDSLNKLLERYQAKVVPMIAGKDDNADQQNLPPSLRNTYFIYPEEGDLDELAEQLRKIDVVDAAYIKPASEEPDIEE